MKRWWLAVLVPMLVTACGDEGPSAVGTDLLPPDVVRTYEIVLQPEQYLVFDTAFGLYSEPRDADYLIVANQFDGGMDANAVVRFNLPPTLSVVDTAGVARVDSMPNWIRGTLRIQVDTLRTSGVPAQLALYRTAQAWDESATWQWSIDEDGTRQAWTTPGGTRGAAIDSTMVFVGRDTVQFQVDSATLALWADTANAARGGLIVMRTAGGRVRSSLPVLTLEARSTHRPDTVYTATASMADATFIFSPEQPETASQPRVGGAHAWRTMMQLRDRLDTLTVACPGVPNCQFQLRDAHLSFAGLRMQPVPPPLGFRPEAALSIASYVLLPAPQIPLQRSQLGSLIGVAAVPDSSFFGPAAPPFDVPLTELLRVLITPPDDRPTDFRGSHVALVAAEPRLFGFATFASLPPLRLVVSLTRDLQLP